MNNFGQIFSFLNKRKKLVKKLIKADNELRKIEKELKEIEQPFIEAKIDVEKYRWHPESMAAPQDLRDMPLKF